MSTLEVADTVTNNDQTEVLLHHPPHVIETILDEQANIVMKQVYRSSYEYVIAFENADHPISITFCETDDQNTIQTEYSMEDFVETEEDTIEQINTLVFSQANGETLTQLFAQYTVE